MQIFLGEQERVFFKFIGRSAKFVHTNARSCNLNRNEKLSLMQKIDTKKKNETRMQIFAGKGEK